MFQVAAAASYAADMGLPCVIPAWPYAGFLADAAGNGFVRFLAEGEALPPVAAEVEERGFAHRESDARTREGLRAAAAVRYLCREWAVSLKGYFQSERFFGAHAARVRALFAPAAHVDEHLDARYGEALRSRPRACAWRAAFHT